MPADVTPQDLGRAPVTDSEIAIVRVEVARQQRERHHRGIAADTVLLLLDEIDRLRKRLKGFEAGTPILCDNDRDMRDLLARILEVTERMDPEMIAEIESWLE